MGSGASTLEERDEQRRISVEQFHCIKDWYSNTQVNDNDLADRLEDAFGTVVSKSDEVRKSNLVTAQTAPTSSSTTSLSSSSSSNCDCFMDSQLRRQWLSSREADELLQHLVQVGERHNHKRDNGSNKKYPLWSLYYGFARKKDGARALDRWGSYHESWMRVMEPTDVLQKYCKKLRKDFNLSDDSVNSIVVNYYYDGDSTYIPAHRDTTACLEENSQIHCLSLGATRDFVLCDNEDTGKFERSEMTIKRDWDVGHGDLFSLGEVTNHAYLHAVPRSTRVMKLRISVIFRSISKSFIKFENTEEKSVEYASGNIHKFAAECISTVDYNDEGKREHIADLISRREISKLAKKIVKGIKTDVISSSNIGSSVLIGGVNNMGGDNEDDDGITNKAKMNDFYLGRDENLVPVPVIAS